MHSPARDGGSTAIVALIAAALVILVAVFPMVRALLEIKQALMLAAAIAAVIAAISSGTLGIHRDVILWWAVSAAALAIAAVNGLIQATPGALREASVYLVWPLVHMSFLPLLRPAVLRVVGVALLWATIAIGVMGIYYVASVAGLLPPFVLPVWLSEESGFAVTFLDGFVRARFLGINSLPFLLPFCISALLVGQGTASAGTRGQRLLVIAAVVIGTACALVSARRALWAVMPLAALLSLAFASQRPAGSRALPLKGAAVAFGVVLLLVTAIPAVLAARNILSGGTISGYLSEGFSRRGADVAAEPAVRSTQAEVLLSKLADAPVLGHGLGSYAPTYIRDFLRPWSYELYYLALASQIGLLGLAAVGASVAWLVWVTVRLLREGNPSAELAIPLVVGMLCYLVASASNPYLPRFDGLWVLFLPIAALNQSLLVSSARSVRVN